MSVRVNLLPEATRAQARVARQRGGLITVFAALLLVLLLLFLWQGRRVTAAEDELAVEQARLAELQGEVARLREFEDLEQRLAATDELLITLLGEEITAAGVLLDLAMVMPNDAQVDTLALILTPADASTTSERPSVGSFTANGQSLNDHAPGVERLLLELDKMVTFHDLFVSDSRRDDPEETFVSFTVEAQLGPEARTGRYAEGLPEALR